MDFVSDKADGASPLLLAANNETVPIYGGALFSKQAGQYLNNAFERELAGSSPAPTPAL